MPETRNILFLGASYAGLGASHYFLKHIYPLLPNGTDITYKAILVDPSTKWFVRHASPRATVSEELMPNEKIFLDIQPNYEQYGDKFQFVQGKAIGWDEKARTVTIEGADGKKQVLSYWALVLGTGSKTFSPLFSSQGTSYEEIQAALSTFHDKLSTAKDIVVAGGGAVGVEVSGELGDALNGSAYWPWESQPNPKAKITLLTSSSRLLPQLRQAISEQAEIYLKRVGVDVRYNEKILSTNTLPNGKTNVVLQSGEQLETDLYIPAMGVRPLSDYVPKHLKNEKGYVVQNNSTLRVDAAGARVYALGDIGTYSGDGIFDIIQGLPVMETNMKRDLLAAHSNPDGQPEEKDRLYVKNEKETQVVPIGRSKGVGAVFGWRIPSVMVWALKGRDFMISSGTSRITGADFAKEA